ncbi:DUF6228 family protein [Phytomonospora endophytica]|uniref:Uncharacterized protein n=1 Tax=Phytomonospora endophytica TaxID=714109 RepID=A0A841FYU4_9ACTN|nr:DUF6228 family protein [Phytomonospora endophytica]MBB6039913.1 hypothetical protein [Phytomonospora endophytica]GIG71017.1 hypothetical protein Pen01_73120 [Phytomonospora endophytica]
MDKPLRLGDPVGHVGLHLVRVVPARDPDHPYAPWRYVLRAEGPQGTFEASAGFWTPDSPGRFLGSLALDFRGWPGERTWRSPDTALHVTATHDGLGHVHLRWTVTDGRLDPGWELTVTTIVDAGEDMRRLAADVRAVERAD